MGESNEGCPSLNDVFPDPQERQQIEKIIEKLIFDDFKASAAAAGALSLFSDPGNDTNGRNLSQTAFAAWMTQFAGVPFDTKRFARRDFEVPDFASRRTIAMANANEFYEIKPDNDNGKRDAAAKILHITGLMTELRLLFVPGIDYDPVNKSITTTVSSGVIDVEVTLSWKRTFPGIVLYKACIKVKKKIQVEQHVVTKILLALLALALALIGAALTGGRSLIPGPAVVPFGPPGPQA